MISEIRIRNLRSLRDTGSVSLKKLNILLGTNSSGKSTFLRSFPLLKQSINKDLRNAISWFDASSVDFGDYETSVNRLAKTDPISFEFVLTPPYYDPGYISYYSYSRVRRILKENKKIVVRIEYSNDNSGTYVSGVIVKVVNCTFSVLCHGRNEELIFSLDDPIMNTFPSGVRFGRFAQNQLIPNVEYPKLEGWESNHRDVREYYKNRVRSFLKKYSSRRLKNVERLDEVFQVWTPSKKDFLSNLQYKVSIQSFSKRAKEWTVDNYEFLDVYNRVGCLKIFDYLEAVNNDITRYYSNCSYLAPVRAEASRYYRTQGLQIDDIDSYGKNLQEFISSLNSEMQKSYKGYCLRVLGAYPSISPYSGQNSILLMSEEEEGTNLTDVGFGFSQILPIVTKLWYATQMMTPTGMPIINSLMDTILIEQPELHLHPAMQAKVADALIACAKSRNVKKMYPALIDFEGTENVEEEVKECRIIVETHSQAIINRIGRRIREGELSPNDVNVVLFEKRSVDSDTEVRQISFDDDGRLKDWPYGFFDPND